MLPVETILLGASLLIILSVIASKVTDRFGIPALLLFLLLGMLAGSDGIGGIYFDDAALAQFVGVLSLALILFSGGLDTSVNRIRPVISRSVMLSILGVVLTAAVFALFARAILGFTMLEGLLLGAIVSSTDAAAVFSILRSKGTELKGNLEPLLELESGSNDPTAVFLTVSMITMVKSPELAFSPLFLISFFQQMGVGAALGLLLGWVACFLVNQLRLGNEGLYPALTLSIALFTYALAHWAGGSGFLAVYLAGIVLSRHDFIHKRSLIRFHDGLAWLMQIVMFLTLGLLVFPSRLVHVALPGLLLALALIFVARPAGVMITMLGSSFSWRERTLISWVGLRGATPIILATFPLLAGVPQSDLIFNMIFFVVLTSVLLQGTTIPLVARWLKVNAPAPVRRRYPIEFNKFGNLSSELDEMLIPPGSAADGRRIVEMELPDDFLVILIARGDEFLLPSGSSVLQSSDVLLVLSEKKSFDQVKTRWIDQPARR
ncbi:MAG TPA: potassium/proton antiporter [Levilinea sp.]|nr:potassium/proton antiporter [Levilinea sp.]